MFGKNTFQTFVIWVGDVHSSFWNNRMNWNWIQDIFLINIVEILASFPCTSLTSDPNFWKYQNRKNIPTFIDTTFTISYTQIYALNNELYHYVPLYLRANTTTHHKLLSIFTRWTSLQYQLWTSLHVYPKTFSIF